ncbi:MAG TPA: cupredoxin domain-containing protein [Gaiellaceae bacterium]|jgi:plastocyanin
MRKLMLLIPAAVLLAGCGGGGGGAGQGQLGENPGVKGTIVTVIEKDFTLTPDAIKLPKPGTYTFKAVNEGAQTHNLEVEGKGVEEKGTNIGFGEKMSFKVTFKKAGDYEIYCPLDDHRTFGMEGTITVG